MDVPFCDAVINFDKAMGSRQLMQRGGRARTEERVYASLVANDDEKASDELRRMLVWNALVGDELKARRLAQRRLAPPSTRLASDCKKALATRALMTNLGALLPLPRAKHFLHMVVYSLDVNVDGEKVSLHSTSDMQKFETNKYFHTQEINASSAAKRFKCRLELPWVDLCGAEVGSQLPHTLETLDGYGSRAEAIDHAALQGCRYLYEIGVVDDELWVVGRREARERLVNAVAQQPTTRSTSRSNAYELALRELVVHQLPRCLQRPQPAVPTAVEEPQERTLLHVFLHAIVFDGAPTGLGLLLASRCDDLGTFQLGAPGKPRQQCELRPWDKPMALSCELIERLSEWHVASLDLVQNGNAHEPLDPTIRAPKQVVDWDHRAGVFKPARVPHDGALATAEDAPDGMDEDGDGTSNAPINLWRRRWPSSAAMSQRAPTSAEQKTTFLAELILRYVWAGSSEPSSAASQSGGLVAVFDLDHTLWDGSCDRFHLGQFERLPMNESERAIYQVGSGVLSVYEEVPLIIAAMRMSGFPIVIASASSAKDTARSLLDMFGLAPESMIIEMRGDDSDERGKEDMLRRISARVGVPADRLVLFDDNKENLKSVRDSLMCGGFLVDPTEGLTVEGLLTGLHFHATALDERSARGVDESGMTAHERSIANEEKRRKGFQARRQKEGAKHAQMDEGPAKRQMRELEIPPAWWLAVPLKLASAAELDGAGSDGADSIDWAHIELAATYCASCKFPSLEEHPPCAPDPRMLACLAPGQRFPSEEAEEPRAGVVTRLEMCALARYAAGDMHYELLKDVAVHENGTVSGEKRTRGVNVSGAAATRSLDASGTYVTAHTLSRKGYQRQHVYMLPLRASYVDALRSLRRLVWLVHHLALVSELDGLRCLHASCPAWLPTDAVPVPLPLLAAAMTHREASAEAVEHLELARRDATRSDERGCADYEVAEWAGDAVLDLLAKAWIMVEKWDDSVRILDPQAVLLLRNRSLYRRGKRLGLPTLGLFRPFEARQRLPNLTKQLVAPKAQADLVESLMGALCLAQVERGPSGTKLARGLNAARAFFEAFVLPEKKAEGEADDRERCGPNGEPWNAAEMLDRTMNKVKLRPAAGQERKGDIEDAFQRIENRPDLLQECCVWSNEIPFQRLEFLGDAFLQCTLLPPHHRPSRPPRKCARAHVGFRCPSHRSSLVAVQMSSRSSSALVTRTRGRAR